MIKKFFCKNKTGLKFEKGGGIKVMTVKKFIHSNPRVLKIINIILDNPIVFAFATCIDCFNKKANNGFPEKSAHPLHYYHIKGTSPIDFWYGP